MKTSFEGKKLYAVIIALLLIITFFITFHIIRNHYQYVVKDTIAENKLTAHLLSSLMYEHQKAAISILESYAQRPLFIDAMKKKDSHRALYHLKSLSERHSEIDALFITDQYGTSLTNYPVSRETYGKNFAYRDWYKGVSKKWSPYISTVYRRLVLEKDPVVAVCVPVFDRKGKAIGILASSQRTLFLATFIKENTIDFRKRIALLDQEGNIIFSNAVPYEEKITKYPDAHVLEKALAGVIIDMEIADAKEKGSLSYVSIAPVRGIGWSVIVGQEKNAILKSLYRYFSLSAVAGVVIFLFLTVSLLYFRREYRYRKTKELQESEERLRTIVEASLDAIMAVNAEGRLVLFNGAAQELFQYSEEEALNQPVDILLREEIGKIHQERLEKFLKRGVGQCGHIGRRMEKLFRRKDGSLFVAEVSMSGGRLDGLRLVVLAIHDITERKQAEEALRERDIQLKKLTSWVPGMIYQFTERPDGTYCVPFTTEAIKGIFGCSPQDVREDFSPIARIILPEDFDKVVGSIEYSAKHLTIWTCEYRVQIPGQSMRWLLGNATPEKLADGSITWYGFNTDITERKRAEEMLRRSEENFRHSLDDSPLGVRIVTAEGETIYTNRVILDIYGFDSLDELKATPSMKRYTPESYAEFQIRREKRRQGEYNPSEYEISIVRKDGEVHQLQVFRKEILWDGERQFQVIYLDITDQKRAEERLWESGQKHREIIENMQEGYHEVDIKGNFTFFNESMRKIIGYEREELLGMNNRQYADEENTHKVYQVYNRVYRTGEPVKNFEWQIIRKDGDRRDIEVSISLITATEVHPAGFRGIVRDITERKRAEEVLRASEERVTKAFRSIPDALVISRLEDGEIIEVNDCWHKVFGYSREEVIGKSSLVLNLFADSADFQRIVALIREQGFVRDLELQIRQKSGALRTVTLSVESLKINGDQYMLTIAQDITDRKRTEKALRESEEKNRALFEDGPIESLVVTIEGRIIQYNKAFERSSEKRGRRLPEIGSKMYVDYASNHSIDMRTELIDCINSKTPKTFNEMPYKGSFLNISIAPTREGAIISAIDVTERKRAEEALRVSEENFRRSMDESPLGIGIVSEEGEILYVNLAILDFFGYESIEELRETPFTKRYMKSGSSEFLGRREKRRLHADESSDYEIDIVRKDGEVRHLQVWRKRVLWNGKEHYQVIYRDITERKQAEERIHASLREKEILLREVHHRVKNNMQVISGLLDLQASSSKNPELIAMFHESQSRIQAMSLVHEKLYGSKDFARIDLAGYVRTLSQDLFQSYKINPGKIDLIVQPDGDVYVDINKAIPCGLILNELISNALKHAFSRYGAGEITIIIGESDSKEIEIVVRDNGLGLPDDVDIHQPRSAGLHLVNGLVKNQLDGQMEVRRDNGTEFRIKFPL